jgi:dihydrofolate reductase
MKIILYMAMTVNGMIAKSDDNTSWVSKEEWDSYSAAVRKAGCLVIGRRTYNILTNQPEFSEFENVKIIAVSKERKNINLVDSKHLVAKSPKEALNMLKDFKEIIVAGGGELNYHFIKENLVDEIYLDIEPLIFGKGIKLFAEGDFEKTLEFVGSKRISDNVIQLHYKVNR